MRDVDLGEPTSFLDHENLGCTRRECQIGKDILYNYRSMFESRISAGDTENCQKQKGLVLNSPLGSPQFVDRALGKVASQQQVLLTGFSTFQTCRAVGYCTCSAHLYDPVTSCGCCTPVLLVCAVQHGDSIRWCFEQLLHTSVSGDRWDIASMPLVMGGLGLRSAHKGRTCFI